MEVSSSPVLLAEGGEALVPVVISPEASEELRASADELSAFLKRITGADFAVEERLEPHGLTIGTIEQFPDDELADELAVRGHYDGLEAFVIRSEGGVVRLLANTDMGVSHAVYRFLELLGCRWFFMGPNWEIIPHSERLEFGLNETSRPVMWYRNIWFDRLAQGGEPGDPHAREVFDEWSRRNRMNSSLKVRASHSWHAIPNDFREEFEANPEYFALVDGERSGPQFCVTNPGLQEIIIEYSRRFFEKNPDADMVSLDPADTSGWCMCEDCRELGHHSAQPFYLANVAARALRKSHPGKYVGLLAYSWHSIPPDFSLEPNVHIQLTRGMNFGEYEYDQLFDMWTQKCDVMTIYEYYSYWQMDRGMIPGTKVTDIRGTARDMREYADSGSVKGISAQSTCNWGIHGLGYYVANRLMWAPHADVEALRRDFLEKSFGAAAPAMGRFYDLFDVSGKPLRGKALLGKMIGELENASRSAEGDEGALSRIDDLKKLIVYSYIGEKYNALRYSGVEDKKAIREIALEWLTWSYRIRNSYMIAWLTFRSTFGRPISEKLDAPQLFWRNTIDAPERNPWRVDEPVTREELDQRLADIKGEIGEIPDVPETDFSGDYVLVATGLESRRRPRSIRASTEANYLLASIEGEPLEITITHEETRLERPDTVYTLSDAEGKEIVSGRLPIGEHELRLEVPGAGVYKLTCFSRRRGFHLSVPVSVPGAFLKEPGRSYRPSGYTPPVYFYVPVGTEEILFHAHRSGTIVIRDGDGEKAYEGISDGNYVSVPVPEGQDGRVWSLGDEIGGPGAGMRLRAFSFLNLPTALSFSPDYVFVPAEVAEADGLEVITPLNR
ncbi:MAG: DUF4838 domain-containing protein [Planctomycetes bacterium]|nr:DUF4838 domain-containing protein [Planctomycetota bacterium]